MKGGCKMFLRNKLLAIAEKSGIKKSELNKLCKIEICALLALSLLGISCKAKEITKPQTPPQKEQSSQVTTTSPQEEPGSPWDNYAAGTRYATVSIFDFALI